MPTRGGYLFGWRFGCCGGCALFDYLGSLFTRALILDNFCNFLDCFGCDIDSNIGNNESGIGCFLCLARSFCSFISCLTFVANSLMGALCRFLNLFDGFRDLFDGCVCLGTPLFECAQSGMMLPEHYP